MHTHKCMKVGMAILSYKVALKMKGIKKEKERH